MTPSGNVTREGVGTPLYYNQSHYNTSYNTLYCIVLYWGIVLQCMVLQCMVKESRGIGVVVPIPLVSLYAASRSMRLSQRSSGRTAACPWTSWSNPSVGFEG